jgi:hypothetical protein
MNNGHTRESKHRIAVLEDEDVETFVAFCEYAYTGDYKVPLPPAPLDDIRKGEVESALSSVNSWRGTHRSESVSSTVPPPAPSPPESVKAGETSALAIEPNPSLAFAEPRLEPTPVIEGDSVEVAAEAQKEAEALGQAVKAEDDTIKKEATEPIESEETPLNQGQVPEAPTPEEDMAEAIPEPSADAGKWIDLEEKSEVPRVSKKKGKKGKKSAKTDRHLEQEPWTEEPAANLTPPSTPPPSNLIEANDIPEGNGPEPELAPEAQRVSEAEPAAESMEKEVEPSAPAEELSAEAEAEADPTPEDWEQPAYPGDDGQIPGDTWADDEVEEQNDTQPPKPVIDMSFAKQSDSSPRTPGLSLWDEFSALQYNNERPISQSTVDSNPSDLPYLTFHAKVYVFATRYLIPALAQLCLQKLHRNLLQLSAPDTENLDPFSGQNLGVLAAYQAPMVLDLLRYAYTKTTRLEPINPTSATQLRENELRRLVIHYAACKVKDLAQYHSPGDSEAATPTLRPMDKVERTKQSAPTSLRALLDMTPELASDLVYRMM